MESNLAVLGAVAALTSSLCWAISLTIYRKFGSHLTGIQLNLFKNFIATIGFFALLIILPYEFDLKNNRDTWLLLGSGVIGFALADSALLSAVNMIGATIPAAIQCLMIPISAFFAFLFYGETLLSHEYWGTAIVLLGVTGSILISHNKNGVTTRVLPKAFWLAILLSILSALGQAVGWMMAKEALKNTHFYEAAFARIAITIPILAIALSLQKKWRPFLDIFRLNRRFLFLAGAGILGTCFSLIFATVGAQYAKIAIVTALLSSYPVFVIPLSFVVLRERTRIPTILFILLTVAGIFVMLRPGA